MMWYAGNGGGWWMAFGWIWMIVFWGLIIWAIFAITRRLGGTPEARTPPEPSALEILERRYARGELSHDQFEEMRQRLTASGRGDRVATGSGHNGGA